MAFILSENLSLNADINWTSAINLYQSLQGTMFISLVHYFVNTYCWFYQES